MQRKAPKPRSTPRPKLGRQVTIRLGEDLYQKLEERADAMNRATPGLNITVSDVIRSMLIALTRVDAGIAANAARPPRRRKPAAADTPAPPTDDVT